MASFFPLTQTDRALARRTAGVDDRPQQVTYDDAVEIAAALFSTPIAFITILDEHREWVTAKVGVRPESHEPGTVFSQYIATTGAALLVEDATEDDRFSDHTSVTGDMHLRFCAGVPLYVQGALVGSLCVIDTVSRIVDKRKLAALGALGRQVSDLLHQRSTSAELAVKEFRLTENVQEAKHTNTLHRFAARRFETLFHGVPIACFTFDEEIVIREWNREAERVFGLAACDAIDENMLTALSVGTRAAGALSAVQHILGGETVEAIEWPYRRTDGCIRRLLTSAFPLRGAQGQIVGGVSATIDITDRKQQERAIRKANSELETANARLARLASHDGLTGIPNYRAFHERLEDEFATSERHGEPLTLLLLDVDRFKSLNDAYGHPVGDRILQELAATLVDTARKGDFVARYGGEEFAVLMPRTSIERAKQLAERIRKAVRNRRWSHGAITISIGCASVDFDVATPADLVKRADRALYRSKNNGRDQVSLYADVA